MGFVHCRACGQPLHLQAAACPYCGAPQSTLVARSTPAGSPTLAIVSCVIGVLTLLAVLSDDFPSDRDELLGAFGFTLIAAACGVLSFVHQKPCRAAAVVGLVTASIGLLICLTHL